MNTLTADEANKLKSLIVKCHTIITNPEKSLEGSVSELLRFLGAEYKDIDNAPKEQ